MMRPPASMGVRLAGSGRARRLALACLLSVPLCVGAWVPRPLGAAEPSARHLETQINTEFRLTGVPFDVYVNQTRKVIDKTRTDLTPENRLRVIDANAPFELRPAARECRQGRQPGQPRYRDGALLIHGLTDSPFVMQDVARFLVSRCFLVRAILLPGHGTVPGDLLSVTYEEWVKATRFGVDSFLATHEVERLVLVGFSTGGSLSIYEGLAQEPVRALVLFSPAVKIKSKLGFMANWHKAVSWAARDKRWMDIAPDDDAAKYESFPFNAADQIYLLTQRLANLGSGKQVAAPLFVALSEDDATVDAADTIDFFKSQRHALSRMILYTNRTADDGDPRIERRASAYPAEHILNFSHLGIHIAPGNPHYGRAGDYRNCLHYLDAAKFQLCKAEGGTVKYGEVAGDNAERFVLRRLTWNPDFDRLMGNLEAFLERID